MQKASSKAFEVFSPTCGPLSTNFLFSFSIDTPIYPIFYHWQNTKDICTVIFLPTLCTYILGNYQEIRVFSQRVKIYWSRQFDDQGTLNQMKTVWQSKKSSKSVGSLFNQFNAFWALSYILINILALFLYMTTTNGFYKGVCFGLFISKNEF